MKYFYGAFLLIAITATSCKNDETAKNEGDPRLLVPFTQQTALTANTTPVTTATSGDHNLFHESNSVATTTVLSGINPAHGQPNHRCDIAVGAPLNSAPNGTAPTQNTNVQTQQVVTATPSNIVTASGMNPPHGEKNHRCDIAVGAPLNSKAAAPVQTPNYVVNQASTAAKTTTAKGMNPPHGEKNHRCDIAVGAPLNSKSPEAPAANSGQVSQQINVQPALPSLLATGTTDAATPSGMNPAHGKEGHRCDIAVGAPLPKT
ncbi:hypothetical protein HNP99_002487 [Flavobacterium sp. 28A]|uniref:hypothetical protein n=1 Tax=Flavobacterium sp. 28A TaxID=2735895 RepID=UPI00156DA5EF|nr:hypothetical protein [Flavobacterium sp. 28A]NRT16125.1 hypothetical protein [Flavobacterium sp. 28A]